MRPITSRAKETYIGQRICLKGKISGIHEGEKYAGVSVAVEGGVEIGLGHVNRESVWVGPGEELNSWNVWRAWMLAISVGDTVEAECEIMALAPTKQQPKMAPGTPILEDCKRVVDGVLWTAPTATPVPTPTPLPCAPARLGDPAYMWLNIDCLAGKVTLGRVIYPDERMDFQPLLGGDSTTVAFYFRPVNGDWSDDLYGHHSPWKRWVEEPENEGEVSFVWEAPPDIAAVITSEWRRGVAVELLMAAGDCCDFNMWFDLAQPPGPLREWRATASRPSPTPTPTRAPTATPTLTPVPTARVVGVTGVAVWSRPAAGDTYQIGETIVVTVAFGEAVDVSGSPHLAIDMDPAEWGRKEVAYAGGSGTATLVFAHEVVEPNVSTLGIAVLENSLELGGGTIRSVATGTDAALAHEGVDHDPVHKVDWRRSQ